MINWNYGTFSGIILDFLGFCVACSYSEEFFNINLEIGFIKEMLGGIKFQMYPINRLTNPLEYSYRAVLLRKLFIVLILEGSSIGLRVF